MTVNFPLPSLSSPYSANERIAASRWRCSSCIQNDLHEGNEEDEDEDEPSESITRRRLSSVPKLARDLLPSHRGVDPGGHSIFKDLILNDDAPDGTRSLRRRKLSHDNEDGPPIQPVRSHRKKASKSPVQATSPVARPRSAKSTQSALGGTIASDADAQQTASDDEEDGSRRTRPRRSKPKRSNDRRPLAWVDEVSPCASCVWGKH